MKKMLVSNLHVRYLIAAIVLLLGAFTINSCKKDSNLTKEVVASTGSATNTDKQLIAEAKSYFDKYVNTLPKIVVNETNQPTKAENLLKSADFDNAVVMNMTVGKVVVTPVAYNDHLYLRYANKNINLSTQTHLYNYQDSTGKKYIEVVTRIPSEEFVKDTSTNKKFSGLILISDWAGKFLKGYVFKNGDITGTLGLPERQKAIQSHIGLNSVKVNSEICFEIGFWQYAYVQQGTSVKVNIDGTWTWIDLGLSCIELGSTGGPTISINPGSGFNPRDYEIGNITGSGSGCTVAQGQSFSGKKINDADPCSANSAANILKNAIDEDEKYLIDCDSLNLLQIKAYQSYGDMYQQVARYTPPQSVIDRINNLINYDYLPDIPHFNLQNLSNAFGPVVNSDFFPVKITNMPSGMNPENLTEYFRTHINDFITGNTRFTPYVDHYTNDTQLFNQPGAASLGALVHIDMLSDGTVIESDYKTSTNATLFKFSTMTSPIDAEHPVSGNREFGVYADPLRPGEFTFYTMGVDRTSSWLTSLGNATGAGFASADALWTDIQTQMINYINRNGGHAEFYNQKHYIARPDWDAVNDYLNGIIDLATLKHRLGC